MYRGRERTVAEAVGDGDGGLGADLQRLGRGAGSEGPARRRRSAGREEAAAATEVCGEEGRGGGGGAGGGAEEDGHSYLVEAGLRVRRRRAVACGGGEVEAESLSQWA